MDMNDIITPLGLSVLLLTYIIGYRRMWCGPAGLLERALEAADEGNIRTLLRLADRMLAGWRKAPQAWYRPEELAGLLVLHACEWEQPEAAQALLDHLGLSCSELVWVEQDAPDIPLLEYVSREPREYPLTLAFLTRERP